MLKANRLGKRYGIRWIFRDVTFELGQGDCLVAEGRNGSGKSTLIKVLAGLIPASEGSIDLPYPDQRRSIGCSSLDQSVYSELSAAEHLQLTADLRGCPSRAEELLDQVGLTHAGSAPAHEFSTGMRARLKLAMAIQHQPPILLLDEPGAGLDQDGLSALARIIADQRNRGCVVIATNDPAEKAYASYIVEMGT